MIPHNIDFHSPRLPALLSTEASGDIQGCDRKDRLLYIHSRALAILVRKDMGWVRLPYERPCETCGGDVERFVRPTRNGCRATEITFCPICSPEVKRVVDIPGTNGDGSDARRWGEALH